MANGVDGVLGGTTTHDAMLWYVTKLLPKYENDTVVVEAMKEACHHNLYAIANSQAMNGIGPDTTIKEVEPIVQSLTRVLSIGFSVLFVVSLVFWIVKANKFRKSEAYATYKEFKKSLKNK